MSSITPYDSLKLTPASKLEKKPNVAMHKIVIEHLRRIEAEIQSASIQHKSDIIYSLPPEVKVDSLSPADAKLYLYSELLRIYNLPEDRGGLGYKARIMYETNDPYLRIYWRPGLDEAERKERQNVLETFNIARK